MRVHRTYWLTLSGEMETTVMPPLLFCVLHFVLSTIFLDPDNIAICWLVFCGIYFLIKPSRGSYKLLINFYYFIVGWRRDIFYESKPLFMGKIVCFFNIFFSPYRLQHNLIIWLLLWCISTLSIMKHYCLSAMCRD